MDWVNYGVTLKNGLLAAGFPIYCTIKVELCSFKVLMHLLLANKGANSWFTFV